MFQRQSFWSKDVNILTDNISCWCNNNNSIQFNSIHVYLRANLTAQMPITKLAREIIIIIIIIIIIVKEFDKAAFYRRYCFEPCLFRMAPELPFRSGILPSFMLPPQDIRVVTRLPLSHDSKYHVITPFLQLFRKRTLHLSSQNWKGVFCLPSAERNGRWIRFRTGISKLCLGSSLRLLRESSLLVATVCKSLFYL
jgi:hypothetical protein